ncbi:putative uncharacterized protein [Clostridium sp. CAG:343]|nr:putative uncharacterized protein [Clostridium sp. CAG:343]HCF34378.1 hypothetical protein [Clostridiales bacterium]
MKSVSIIIYLILSVGGLVLVKSGSSSVNIAIQDGTFNFAMGLKAMLGFIAYIGSFLIYTFYIIKNFDLSYIFPIITGITQVLVIIAGVFIFKEQINAYTIGGILLIIMGIVLLNIK